MAISNMQQARQLRAGGGIMDLEPRQGYFLGKAVKKIGRGLKKVVKSPLGKAALIGAAGYGLGGGFSKAGFAKNTLLSRLGLGKFQNVGGNRIFQTNKFGSMLGKLNPFTNPNLSFGQKALIGGGLAATALPFLMGGGEDDEEEVTESFSVTPSSITDIVSMAKARDPSLRFLPQNAYTQQGFFGAADGGIARIGFNNGGLSKYEILSLKNLGYDTKGGTVLKPFGGLNVLKDILKVNKYADGGIARTGYAMGGPTEDVMVENVDTQEVVSNPDPMAELNMLSIELFGKRLDQLNETERGQLQELIQSRMQEQAEDRVMAESGGMMDYMSSANPMADSYIMEDTDIVNMYRPSGDRQMAAEGGIMDLGGMEKDYREEGGFVPIGGEEKADDVPARLSKNEFVFTADAVRNAGGGDIDRGAEVMENLMNNLEQGGEVSEESQGNPAQEMFDTAQMLESRIA